MIVAASISDQVYSNEDLPRLPLLLPVHPDQRDGELRVDHVDHVLGQGGDDGDQVCCSSRSGTIQTWSQTSQQ